MYYTIITITRARADAHYFYIRNHFLKSTRKVDYMYYTYVITQRKFIYPSFNLLLSFFRSNFLALFSYIMIDRMFSVFFESFASINTSKSICSDLFMRRIIDYRIVSTPGKHLPQVYLSNDYVWIR